MADLPKVVEAIATTVFAEEFEKAGVLARHRDRFERNIVGASGGNPADPKSFNRQPKWPTKSEIRDPEELVAVKVDPASGLKARSGCPEKIVEMFLPGTEPEEACPLTAGRTLAADDAPV